jgi:hypothetical protein
VSCSPERKLSSGEGVAFSRSSVVAPSLSFSSVELGADDKAASADELEDPLLDVRVNELLRVELLVAV